MTTIETSIELSIERSIVTPMKRQSRYQLNDQSIRYTKRSQMVSINLLRVDSILEGAKMIVESLAQMHMYTQYSNSNITYYFNKVQFSGACIYYEDPN